MTTSLLLLSFVVIFGTDGTLTSYENKYFDFKRLSNVNLRVRSESKLFHREKRSGQLTNDNMLFTNFVLNGSENHAQAFVHWSGKEKSEGVFLLTLKFSENGTIIDSQTWRSMDYGKTFKKYDFGKNSLITYFFVSPVDHNKMVFTDVKNKILYTTSDELNSTHKVSLPTASDIIDMHPNDSDCMLLYDSKQRKLYVTMNFGENWTLLQSDVNSRFFWEKTGPQSLNHSHVVHLEVQPQGSEQAFYKKCTLPACQAADDSIDDELGPILPQTLHVANEFIFVQKSNPDGSDSHMMVSHNRKGFRRAFFPANVKTQNFLVLDASEAQVFMAVSHGDNKGVSLYLSDTTGRFYVLTLENVHHQSLMDYFEVDLHRVKGLPATYLANQEIESVIGQGPKLQTLISLDKGGHWMPISSPDNSCSPPTSCSVLLRLDLENFVHGWMVSEENAPGFIIAHGHLGQQYVQDRSQVSVFTSRDGGYNWTRTNLTGLYHFNILDQGGIITAILDGDQGSTNNVYYSYDEGLSWKNASFNDSLKVDGVLNEPGINTLVVSVYGHKDQGAPWEMTQLNFSGILPDKCSNTSYYKWTPSDPYKSSQEFCILGQKVSYQRRKKDSKCYNGEDFSRAIVYSACSCNYEDFECDFGYEEDENLKLCKIENWFDNSYKGLDCKEGQPFNESQGYRKVASDKCVGGLETNATYLPKISICPSVAPDELMLISNVSIAAIGAPVLFHLSQGKGSKINTTYDWNFNDTRIVKYMGLFNTSKQIHVFTQPGLYNVVVKATNINGSSTSNVLQIRVEEIILRVGIFASRAAKVGYLFVADVFTNIQSSDKLGSLHYVWFFGDEAPQTPGFLTWDSHVNHTFKMSGNYTMTVIALNAVSALSRQVTVRVFGDDAVLLRLHFSDSLNVLRSSVLMQSYFVSNVHHELAVVVGVNMDRLALTLDSTVPLIISLMVTPLISAGENVSVQMIVDTIVTMVKNKTLVLYKFSFNFPKIEVISVDVIKGENSGETSPNFRALFIALPVLVLIVIVIILIFIYYRKRFHNMDRYSMLSQREDDDALLDDEPPLDLRPDRSETRHHDDHMLDLGTGSHLVLVTGTGGGDNAENC